MTRVARVFKLFFLLIVFSPLVATVYDNRFLPFLGRPIFASDGASSFVAVDFVAATASGAFGDKQSDKGLGLPEMFGKFDLVKLNEPLVLGDCADGPFPGGCPTDLDATTVRLCPEWRGGELLWRVDGRIQTQGVAFYLHKRLHECFSVGATWQVIRANSCHDFIRGDTNLILGTGDAEVIEVRRRRILDALGLCAGHWRKVGLSDVDLYARLSGRWDYKYKFRSIDAGFRVGLLAPTGGARDENRPPSFSFGGDGFWGMYVGADLQLELREDLTIGAMARASKRFARTVCKRFPLHEEPQIFGAARAKVDLNPGTTLVFSPYVRLDNLREGLGLGVQYTLTSHRRDSWRCVELVDPCSAAIATNEMLTKGVKSVEESSKWGSDYITINAFYDFGKMKVFREFEPILSFRWDVPAKLLVVNRCAKTHRISLGLECTF